MRRFLAAFAIATALLAPAAMPALAQSSGNSFTNPQATIDTQIVIPGSPVETTASGLLRGKVASLGAYIGIIYNFLLSIVGVVAGVSMVYGGFLWMTSGGAADRATKGKKRIQDSLIGLILAFSAYVILNTINPDLLNFKPLYIPVIKPVAYNSPRVAPEGLCDTDQDCLPPKYDKGYRCFHVLTSGPGKQDGLCAKAQVNAPDNAVCTADSECASKRCLKLHPSSNDGVCSGGTDKSYCLSDQNCTSGKCVDTGNMKTCSIGAAASYCSSDSDCGSGLKCVTIGYVGRCSSGKVANFGDPCKSEQDCSTIGGTCEIQQAQNSSCDTKGDNGTYYLCFCRTKDPQPSGNYCYNNQDCTSGNCYVDTSAQGSGGRPGALGHCK